MEFKKDNLYHIYNRGNNRKSIFYNDENYLFFLKKVRKYILPYCDILCYCLMPNHFHFIVSSNQQSIQIKPGAIEMNALSSGIKSLLSTYTQAVNKQNHFSGSLFLQNTKAKILTSENGPLAFHYIHQNPLKAGLCSRLEDWPYSSFADFIGKRNGTLCNKALAIALLNLNSDELYEDSYRVIVDEHTLINIT